MNFMIQMVIQGVHALHHDPNLGGATARTIQLAVESTLFAAILGFPLACVIGLGRAHVSRWSLIVANAGLGLPPVGVGVYGLFLLAYEPWGTQWHNMNGMVLLQTILALPVIVALGAIAIRRLPDGLVDQARAYGSSGWRLGVFALREARIGAVAAVILAMGSAISEVGAVTIIGGNAIGVTTTLASQVLNDVKTAGGIPFAVGHLIVLFGLMLVLGAIFFVVQQWDSRSARRRARGGPPLIAIAGANAWTASTGGER
jgi:tungstate transport system permease protein